MAALVTYAVERDTGSPKPPSTRRRTEILAETVGGHAQTQGVLVDFSSARPGGPGHHEPTEVGQGQGGTMPSLLVKHPGEMVGATPEPDWAR